MFFAYVGAPGKCSLQPFAGSTPTPVNFLLFSPKSIWNYPIKFPCGLHCITSFCPANLFNFLHIFTNLGGIAYLLPPLDDFAYEFTLIEIYGGAELTFDRNRTVVRSEEVVGDDTGYLHVGPYHTLDINKVK